MKDRIEAIEKRLDRVERMIERIVALPHLTNLAGKDITLQIQRAERTMDFLRTEIRNSQGNNINLQERLSKCEYLVSPALSIEPHDSES